MIALLLSVLFSACLPLLLKAFEVWRVSVVLAVAVNYVVCVGLGLTLSSGDASVLFALRPWTPLAAVQGALLAGNFYLLAFAAQRTGVAMASLSSRLSVALPVVLAIPLYGERLSLVNILGVALALFSLFLASGFWPPAAKARSNRWGWLSIVVFVAFGLHFALLKYVQHTYLLPTQHHDYVGTAFFFGLVASWGILLFTMRTNLPGRPLRGVLGGCLLGSCNYCALFFLTRVLSTSGWQSAIVFPTYSVAVVMLTTAGAVLLFAEHISPVQRAGIGVGVVAVVLLNV